jgi:hypothetical protein
MSMTGIAFNLILIRAARHCVEERQKEVDVAPKSNIQFFAHRDESTIGDTLSTMSAV